MYNLVITYLNDKLVGIYQINIIITSHDKFLMISIKLMIKYKSIYVKKNYNIYL